MTSPLHRLPAGAKLAAMALCGTAAMAIGDWRLMAAFLALVALGFPLAGFGARVLVAQIRPLFWMLALLFLAQGWLASWPVAALVVIRIAALMLLASLVTLTTRTEAMIATVERLLAPLAPLGVNPAKVGLAFSLALRFLPVIGEEAERVREAQAARGLGTHPVALIVPLIVRVLKAADDVAAAIEARAIEDLPERDSARATH